MGLTEAIEKAKEALESLEWSEGDVKKLTLEKLSEKEAQTCLLDHKQDILKEVEELREGTRSDSELTNDKRIRIKMQNAEVDQLQANIEIEQTVLRNVKDELQEYQIKSKEAVAAFPAGDIKLLDDVKKKVRAFYHLIGVLWDPSSRLPVTGIVLNHTTQKIRPIKLETDVKDGEVVRKNWETIEATTKHS